MSLRLQIQTPPECGAHVEDLEICPSIPDALLVIEVRLCEWCSTPFAPKRKKHRFCSRRCMKTSNRKAPSGPQ